MANAFGLIVWMQWEHVSRVARSVVASAQAGGGAGHAAQPHRPGP